MVPRATVAANTAALTVCMCDLSSVNGRDRICLSAPRFDRQSAAAARHVFLITWL
jgi:hypothetical protein